LLKQINFLEVLIGQFIYLLLLLGFELCHFLGLIEQLFSELILCGLILKVRFEPLQYFIEVAFANAK
jgi:hypothetical protein